MKLGSIDLSAESYSVDEVVDLAKRYADQRVRGVSDERDSVRKELESLKAELVDVKGGAEAAVAEFESRLVKAVEEAEGKVRGELGSELDAVRAELDEVRGGVAGTFDEQLAAFKSRVGDGFVDVIDSLPGSSAEKVSYLIKHGDVLFGSRVGGFGSETGAVSGDGGSGDIVASLKSMSYDDRMLFLARDDNMGKFRDAIDGNEGVFNEVMFGA